ncbi:MAG: signal recognition particle-docking protein FtsY, partial [SAR202 cluster bacterium]|nr:signal recognition particle-docking protein FtsY [SAR202 cluster bacterium]
MKLTIKSKLLTSSLLTFSLIFMTGLAPVMLAQEYDDYGGDFDFVEPVFEEFVYEEPVYEEPVYEEPVYEEPVFE